MTQLKDNYVIEVENLKHGNEVRDFFKKNGVSNQILSNFGFTNTKGCNDPCRFYGLCDGRFDTFSSEEVIKKSLVIIKLPEQSQSQSISRTNLKKIYDVACTDWKNKLTIKANSNPYDEFVEFSEKEIIEMYNAATFSQLSVINDFFVKPNYDDITIKINAFDSANPQELLDFNKVAFGGVNIIRILNGSETSPEYRYRGFLIDKSVEVKQTNLENGGTQIIFLNKK